MRVAAVIQGSQIVPIIAGPTIRIRETETGEDTELANPAWGLDRDRRPTAARALVAARVDVILTPPGSFCSPSHALARQAGIRFWQIGSGVDWDTLWKAHRYPASNELVSRLPRRSLMRQNVSSLAHYARLALRDWSNTRRTPGAIPSATTAEDVVRSPDQARAEASYSD